MERTLGSNTFDIARSNRRSSSLLGTMKLWQRRIQSRASWPAWTPACSPTPASAKPSATPS